MSSYIEKEILSLMINEFFFTTHNLDILDLPLCKHSFNFLKKDDQGISVVNTDLIRSAVDHNLFSVAIDWMILKIYKPSIYL